MKVFENMVISCRLLLSHCQFIMFSAAKPRWIFRVKEARVSNLSLFNAIILCVGFIFIGTGAATAQEACGTYTIRQGDTLREITLKAFGIDNYWIIYRKNVQVIGDNPNLIKTGTQLNIPCFDLSNTSEAIDAASDRKSKVEEPAQTADGALHIVLTAGGYAPYVDEGAIDKGILVRIFEQAILRSGSKTNYDIQFINDREKHLGILMPLDVFSVGFPWAKPNCEVPESLSTNDKILCERYNFSRSLYTTVETYVARDESIYSNASTFDVLKGARICRAEGFAIDHLRINGLVDENNPLMRPTDIETCFEKILVGDVDVIAIDAQIGHDMLRRMSLQNDLKVNENLSTTKTLHAIAFKQDQHANDLINTIDTGLTIMRETGEWYYIVSKALKNQMQK